MNTYMVIFHCVGGTTYKTQTNGNNLEEAMENLTNHFINETQYLFHEDKSRCVLLNSQHIFYTEFILVENSSEDETTGKEFELFSFSQFANLSDNDMKIVINYIKDDDLLAKALKGAESSIADKFYDNMDRQKKLSVTVAEETLNDVPSDEIESLQREICTIALQLAAEGDITLH